MKRVLKDSTDPARCCRKCDWWRWFTTHPVVGAPGLDVRACAFDVGYERRAIPAATLPDEVCDAFAERAP